MKRSKNYRSKIRPYAESGKTYSPEEAIASLKESSYVKFDSSIDLAIKFPISKKKSENSTKLFYVDLPAGHGKKKVGVAAFLDNVEQDKMDSVDKVADSEFVERLLTDKKLCKRYIYVSSSSAMVKARKLAGILGPKGLMPNVNFGTVTDNINATARLIKTSRVFLRLTKNRHIALRIGGIKMDSSALLENFYYATNEIIKAASLSKAVKNYSVYLTSTMGAGLRISM